MEPSEPIDRQSETRPIHTTVSIAKQPPNSSYLTRITGFPLDFARLLWLILVIGLLVILIFDIPPRFNELLRTSGSGGRAIHQLTEQEAQILAGWGLSTQFYAVYCIVFEIVQAAGFILVGGLIFIRRSDHWQGLFVSFALVTFGVAYPPIVRSFATFGNLTSTIVFSLGSAVFVAFAYTFPDGRFVPYWTRYFVVAVALWALALVLIPQLDVVSWPVLLRFALVGGLTVPCIIAQIYRYRKVSTPTEREQTKWIVLSTALLIIDYSFDGSIRAIPTIGNPGLVHLLFNLLIAIPLLETGIAVLVPVFIGVAILRYRLWDVNILINRTLVYTALAGILSLLYFAGVILLQQIFLAYTGGQQSSLAIAITTLVIAGLFQPIRRRLWAFVTRRLRVATLVHSPDAVLTTEDAINMPLVAGPLTGTQLGSYEIRELIGRGGMAEVYKGWHKALHRTVAVKTLLKSRALDNSFRKRFEREAQTVAALHDPHIVQVFDFGYINDVYYMVMEYIEGPTLAAYLRTNGPLPLSQVLSFARDIASALDYAHHKGVIHRDVKPSNVMLQPINTADGTPPGMSAILTDFGLARLLTRISTQTQTETMGTLGYMAPEQIASFTHVGPGTDIYALGVMVYEMLTGKLPFLDDNIAAILLAHLQRPAPDPRQVAPDLPKHVALAVLQALAKEPDERYPSATAFVNAMTP